MATTQLGNHLGVAARAEDTQYIAVVQANAGAGAFSVDIVTPGGIAYQKLKDDQLIDIYSPAGVARALNRSVVYIIGSSGVVAYNGVDAPGVTAGDLVYIAGARTKNQPSNINGGVSAARGFVLPWADSIDGMRLRLNQINSTYYTSARLDGLTFNDMVYALRLSQAPGSI